MHHQAGLLGIYVNRGILFPEDDFDGLRHLDNKETHI